MCHFGRLKQFIVLLWVVAMVAGCCPPRFLRFVAADPPARPAGPPADLGDKETALLALVEPYTAPDYGPGWELFQQGLEKELAGQYREAGVLYQDAVSRGSSYASYRLGLLRLSGKDGYQNLHVSTSLFKQAAEQGFVPAMVRLGDAYFFGRGTVRRLDDAITWYETAANSQEPYALILLSIMYKDGLYVAQDLQKSVDYFFRAEKESMVFDAMFKVGRLYALGRGFDKDYQKAIYWYDLSAKGGDARAMIALGDCYREGRVGPRNNALALARYYDAVRAGSPYAAYNLATMYYNGQGITKNMPEALRWFKQAAEGGAEHAQYRLAELYFRGEGTTRNDVEAYAWWSVAGHDRKEGTLPQMKQLVARMSPDEQRRALALADSYRSRYKKALTPEFD